MKTLRPYQQSANDSLFDYLFTKKGHPLVVAPVAAGKSLLIAEFIRQVHEKYPNTRIVMLSHVKELLVQDAEELRIQYPTCDFGFYSASLREKKLYNSVTFATIQSVHSKIMAFNRCPEIIIIDECHLISHNDATQYRRFIDSVIALNPNVKVIGYTGTPFRADHGRLDEGNGKLFDDIAYEIPISYMIEEGYWAKPSVPKVNTTMNIEGVATRKGDYVESQLEKAIDVDETTQACIKEIIHHGADRSKWLIFTAGVQHCEHVRDALRASGVSAEMVIGDKKIMSDTERDNIIKRYKNGEFKALCNVAVLTTGFNVPDIDMLVFMRPTKSPVLYIQCTGRGVRPVYAPGFDLNTREGRLSAIAASKKPDCRILDFGGVIKALGPIDTIDIRKKGYVELKEGGEVGETLFKRCPACGAECAPAQTYCYLCSFCFIKIEKNSEKDKQILSTDEPPQVERCLGMVQKFHAKKIDPDNPTQKPATMQVTYSTMSGPYKEWVCFNHTGYARDKAIKWHRDRLPDVPVPASVEEALLIKYPCPTTITVKREDKYFRIVSVGFEEQVAAAPSEEMSLADFDEIGV